MKNIIIKENICKLEAKYLLRVKLYKKRSLIINRLLEKRFLFYNHIINVLKYYNPSCVGFYWPINEELDIRNLILEWIRKTGKSKAALPVIKKNNKILKFYEWSYDTRMHKNFYKIKEPKFSKLIMPDLIFLPCIGFDELKHRLGYGGGYYDRTISKWPSSNLPITIGIAYEECRIFGNNFESYDIKLDRIITDKQIN